MQSHAMLWRKGLVGCRRDAGKQQGSVANLARQHSKLYQGIER